MSVVFSSGVNFVRNSKPATGLGGRMIGANDLFIAAHARCLGLRLVMNNTAEFSRVKGLTLENWTLPTRRSRSRNDKDVES